MSHLVENMAYVGQVPWHGLGVPVSNDLTVYEMQEACGANFKVMKEPEYFTHNGVQIPTGNYSLYRQKMGETKVEYLDSVSEEWVFPQPDEAFEFFQEWVESGEMHLHTAGVLDNGRMIWAMAKVNDGFSLFKGKDHVESNLLFSCPFRYGKATTVMGTHIRVVCNNTLQLALSSGAKHKDGMMVRVNHRREIDSEEIKKALHLNRAKMTTYKEAAEFISKKKADKEQVWDFFKQIFPRTSNKNEEADDSSRNAKMLLDVIESQPGADLGAGTWWQAFNAVTYSVDHLVGNTDSTRLFNAFYGGGRDRKVNALKLATEYAQAA